MYAKETDEGQQKYKKTEFLAVNIYCIEDRPKESIIYEGEYYL